MVSFSPARIVGFVSLVILGWIVGFQIYFMEIFFGRDYFHWVLSIGLPILTFHFLGARSIKLPTALPLFFVLAAVSPLLSHTLLTLSDFISIIQYGWLLGLAVLLKLGTEQQPKQRFIQILPFLIGIGLAIVIKNNLVLHGLIFAGLGLSLFSRRFISVRTKLISLIFLVGLPVITHQTQSVKIHPIQDKYFDPVVFSLKTAFQQIDITEWKGNHWFYFNRLNRFSSIDHWMYHEPLVHPAIALAHDPKRILVLGGEDGLAVQEVLKHKRVASINLIPIDTAFLTMGLKNDMLIELNKNSLRDLKVKILPADLLFELSQKTEQYDLIISDLPDPIDLETNQNYTVEFFELCKNALRKNGVFVTQSGSPYFATQAFETINETMKSAGFNTMQLHNQIPTAGEWGWTIGIQDSLNIQQKLGYYNFDQIETKWLNDEAIQMMQAFGKSQITQSEIEINSLKNPVLFKYYLKGNWQL